MLRIITGRSSSGKSEKMLDFMKDSREAVYIVPEQYSFAAEKKITDAFGMSGMGYPSVYSFRRLAYYFEELYGADAKESLGAVGRCMILGDIVRRLSGKLSLFGGAARRGEMASEAAVIVTTFKQYNITKAKIEAAMEKTGNGLLKKKLSDCMLICEAYDKFLEEGYRDEEDLLSVLAVSVEKEDYLEGKDVFIDSFLAFTPLEYTVISKMLKKAKSVTVSLCLADGGDEFVTARRTKDRLIRLAGEAGVPVGGIIELDGAMYTASDEMKCLERSFFDENEVYGGKTDRVEIHKVMDEYAEVESCAREIESLCRDKGYRYRDIVVVVRETASYEKHFARVFGRFDIPLYMDRKTPLAMEAAAVFALSAIRIVSRGWRNDDVFSYMKSPFAPVDAIAACAVENYCLASGVRARDWRSGEDWEMSSSVKEEEIDGEYLKRINEARVKISEPLVRLEGRIRGKKTGREMVVAFYEFLEDCSLAEKIEKTALSLEEKGYGDRAMRTRQVYEMLIGILESFDDAFGERTLSAEEFFEILTKGVEAVEIGAIPSSTDSVCVGSIDRARGHGAKAVLILGCNEGVFPASVTDEGIFTSMDKQELLSYGIELPPDTLGKAYMEESLVYSALSCATEFLYVSYCGGKEGLNPSSMVKRIKRVFPDCVAEDEIKNPDLAISVGSAKSSCEDFAVNYAKLKNGEAVSDAWLTAIDYYKANDEWKDMVREIEKHTSYENKCELIKAELLDIRYRGRIDTSVSRLEMYAQCPFRYFAAVTLSLRERKELEVTAAESGTFLHEFVDMFGKGLLRDKLTWRDADEAYIDRRSEEITFELIKGLNKHLLETSPRVRNLFVRLKKIAKRSVTALCEHMKKGSFEPLGYEIVFDRDGDFKPLTIDLPNGQKAYLRGRVDRADVLETKKGSFVRIIDYKSGDKKFSMGNIYYGLDLQLAIYLTTICEQGEYHPAGMLYFKIDDPVVDKRDDFDDEMYEKEAMKKLKMDGLVLADDEILSAMDTSYAAGSSVIPVKKTKTGEFDARSHVATETDFAAISKHARGIVKKLCGEILSGRSDISPVRGACSYCEMKNLCGFDTSIKGCSYRSLGKLNDKEALLKIIEEEKVK